MTTAKQSVDTYQVAAFLDGCEGVGMITITVLNGWKLEKVNLYGRKPEYFASLYDCVYTRLVELGFDMRNFDFNGKL